METIGKIRRWHRVEGLSISQIAKRLGASRNTVAKYLASEVTKPRYKAREKRYPVMDAWSDRLKAMLDEDARLPRTAQRNGQRIYDLLVMEGFPGSYATVQRRVRAWKQAHRSDSAGVFIPLVFAPGEAFQFDWSYETAVIGGKLTPLKVAHLRLCHSRGFLAVAYLRESREMVFDAHWRAFEFWGGVPRRGIYDNLRTAVDLIFAGKVRRYNARFLQMASHYLFEPVACTPASGWEKGQVENQVGHVREQIFTPRLKAATLDELNATIQRRCVEVMGGLKHPEQTDASRETVLEAERSHLLSLPPMYDGFSEREVRVSSTALIHYDRNRYSVDARFAGKTVSVRAYAAEMVMVADGAVVGRHVRSFERDRTCFDPWHYLSVLDRKPGALRNGAPFKDWQLPEPLIQIKAQMLRKPGGDRQFVSILQAMQIEGVEPVTAACELALETGAATAEVVLNILNRCRAAPIAEPIPTPDALKLKQEPQANVLRYDGLLKKPSLSIFIAEPLMALAHTAQEVAHAAR